MREADLNLGKVHYFMSKSSISVAMTTFNGSKYLGEQLKSLSSQTVKPLELVVCDDGSTDETMTILDSFAALAPFAVRISQNAEHLGYQRNFIKSASLCKGSLIAFCDQDDIWNDDKLEVVNQHFMASDDLLVGHDYSVFFENGRQLIPSYFHNLALSGLLPVVSISGCSLALRRELIEMVAWPPPESNWSHDMWVSFVALLLGKRGYIRQPLIQYRMHGKNASGCLVGGKSWSRRWLRRFQVPPFTSRTDLDSFIAHFVKPKDIFLYHDAIQQCGPAMTDDQRQRALSSLAKSRAICDFISSEAYLHPVTRTLGAMHLFLRSAYCGGDGILGLAKDIVGSRTWRTTRSGALS
jgi:glycosyltransferase involved in cell wall biosynthesis